jgi:hypothetical protein
MPLVSIWDYLRQRTRDAVLAGFEDALEVAEPNGQASSEYEAARKLRHRLEAVSVLEASAQTALPPVVVADRQGSSAAGAAVVRTVDDLIDARLNGAVAPAVPPPVSGSQPHPARRKRGRPPKDAPR